MTRYEGRLDFGGDVPEDEIKIWAEELEKGMPEGSVVSIKVVPLVLDLNEVTEEHAGNRVTIRGYFEHIKPKDKKAAKEQAGRIVQSAHLSGVLEHVYPTGGHPVSRTLVIDGAAYAIPAYSLVELGEW